MELAPPRRRMLTALAVILAHALLIWLLARTGMVQLPPKVASIIMVDVPAPAPPAPPAEKPGTPEPEAAAAPPAPRARPKPTAAPPPDVRVEPEKPEPTPPAAADGAESKAGAAAAGPGSGAQGQGIGLGSGDAGSGTGGGGGIVRARWKSGRIDRRDYPEAEARRNIGGSVTAHFDVTPEGRVTNCRVVRSSGAPALDATTCRLLEQRFRYTPARNSRGEPVADVMGWRQDWWLEPPR